MSNNKLKNITKVKKSLSSFLLKYWYVLVVFVVLVVFPARALAATPTLSVSPSIVYLDLSTDLPQTTLTYTNHSQESIQLSFSASDVVELEDGYQLSFLNPKSAQNFQYRLSSWISFGQNSLILSPGQSGSVIVSIAKDKLSPGGHYGSILASIQQKNGSGAVSVQAVLSSLIFVRSHTGVENEAGHITSFNLSQQWWDFPSMGVLRFNNTGDVELVPYGLIQILDSQNHLVAKGIVNETSAMTLPETLRRYDIPLTSLSSFLFPGWYHATLSLHFGKSNEKATQTLVFFTQGSIPLTTICIVFLILGSLYLYWKRPR